MLQTQHLRSLGFVHPNHYLLSHYWILNYYNDLANKQPKGSYAAANHNHNGVYQPAGSYAAASHSHTFASLTSKPTTLSGYGITDGITTAIKTGNIDNIEFAKFGKIVVLSYQHNTGGVIRNKEYPLSTCAKLGIPNPKLGGKSMFGLLMIETSFNYEGCGVLKVDANGAITMISGLTHTEPKSYIGQLCFICQ